MKYLLVTLPDSAPMSDLHTAVKTFKHLSYHVSDEPEDIMVLLKSLPSKKHNNTTYYMRETRRIRLDNKNYRKSLLNEKAEENFSRAAPSQFPIKETKVIVTSQAVGLSEDLLPPILQAYAPNPIANDAESEERKNETPADLGQTMRAAAPMSTYYQMDTGRILHAFQRNWMQDANEVCDSNKSLPKLLICRGS